MRAGTYMTTDARGKFVRNCWPPSCTEPEGSLPDTVLSQLNSGHTLTSNFGIHFNIILPYTPRSSNWPVMSI